MQTKTSRQAQRRFDPEISFNRGIIAQTGFIPEGAMFLQDSFPLEVKDVKPILTEGISGGPVQSLKVVGLFQKADEANANGRIYSQNVLREAVEAISRDCQNRATLGEFDHPQDARIHLDRVSHLVTNIWMEGRNVFGEAEILDELPFGNQLKSLLGKHRVRVGISSRGIGDMEVREHNGQEVHFVCEGFRFVTWDCVAEPSVHGATLQLCENKLRPIKKSVQRSASLLESKDYEKLLLREFNQVLRTRR